jgi:hypothetical protein
MEPITIIMMVVVFVLLYMIYYYYISKNSMLMSGITSGKQVTTINASKIDKGSSSAAGVVNFTYSMWFNINDWNDGYGLKKPLFQKVRSGDQYTIDTYFAENQNDLMIDVFTGSPDNSKTTCTIRNVPIQKWVHLLISVYGKSLDTYINGKLVNTCILNGVPLVNKEGPINITPGNGFNGWTAQFQYWADATDPQTAWNIYKKGNGNTIFSNMFGNYGLKIALMSDGEEANTISI